MMKKEDNVEYSWAVLCKKLDFVLFCHLLDSGKLRQNDTISLLHHKNSEKSGHLKNLM